ncbi:MAG: N-acetyl-gamma-glutamyl-phosphate reductase [Caldilineaceae bacterium]|nr:N-acetyl-gamma-glutamyl-phosphate reductase [Caldilineaceae bacterium]
MSQQAVYKAGIAGATGYTGYELIRLIQRHPQLEIGWLTSENSAGKRFSNVFDAPWDYPLIRLEDALSRAAEVDVVFLCLPHAASIGPVKAFVEAGVLAIDLSADFRLIDSAIYEKWYQTTHTAPELLNQFVYGLCEVYREQIRNARLIANPGCYPTSVNLGLYPLAKAGWLGERVIVDSKSGISGAGRKADLKYSFAETNENMTPYNVGMRHRHIAEMEQVLNRVNGHKPHRFVFSPHLLPVTRGILSTMYVDVPEGVTQSQIRDLYAETYANEPFIHLLPAGQMASLRHTVHSNRCAISITPVDPAQPDGTEYIIASSEDNLIKGASGQALQNFNIAVGLEETMGLL